ncbi:MAG: hypothetical protein MUP30_03170 [Deltaproteobacteria bacterium]|nr:hypothetical protein [Deltaproteobacteria bacterium]
MKRALILLTMVFVVLVLGTMTIANDMDDLKKLQPLTADEQPLYEQVKNNAAELHKFIATRTYLRTVEKIIGPDWATKVLKEDWEVKDTKPYVAELPKLNKDVDMEYAVSLEEQQLIFKIMVHQRTK